MNNHTYPHTLDAERLMAHVRHLSETIGPRPPTSAQERAGHDYVKSALRSLGINQIWEQPFASQPSYGWMVIPINLAGILVMFIAWLGGRLGKLIAALGMAGGAYSMREFFLARPPFFKKFITRRRSQNVIAHIQPAGETRQRLYLVGHLDTNQQRFLAPWPNNALTKPFNTLTVALPLINGLTLLYDFVRGRTGLSTLQKAATAFMSTGLVLALNDERQPHIPGANDNATAVAILLAIAATLQEQPLAHTEVILLFTGCEEVVCVGMENYLQKFAPGREDSYWLDLEMVGTGDLCYVTCHGVSHLSEYQPHPEMVALAAKTAALNPELGVIGKDMVIVEEVANLRYHNYRALCLAGYDDGGYLPNWHRLSDNLANIEPETLERAGRFTWSLLQEIDQL